MMPWFVRFAARITGVLLVMLLVELIAFWLARDYGINRLFWVPVSFALVAFAGYDTVKRLPLVWGAVVGALLAGSANCVSWMIGSYVMDGEFRMPDEAEPLLLGTSVMMAAIIGGIVAVVAGLVARNRRRQRSRRSALGKLAYSAYDEPMDPNGEVSAPIAMPMGARGERTERP